MSLDDSLPYLLYLQGGPGSQAPRSAPWISEALKHYRVVLVDQRGTGRSCRIDRFADPALLDFDHLRRLRADDIVADCEDLREHLEISQWDVLGQSFGGFCITTYLSGCPASIRYAYFTGGLPATTVGIDDVYRMTYSKVAAQCEKFYSEVSFAEQRVREVCDHLDNAEEFLPTGERLSSRRFRTVGIDLGRATGFDSLAELLGEPFHRIRGEKRLRGDFLSALSGRLSFESAPLYAVIHESIYGAPGQPTRWSAHRMREEVEGFSEFASPVEDEKFYLTGEHIYPWQFDEDPALRPFKGVAGQLAEYDGWSPLYGDLSESSAICASAVYRDDIFVPREFSLETASAMRDNRVWETADYQHDGLRRDGAGIFGRLYSKVRED